MADTAGSWFSYSENRSNLVQLRQTRRAFLFVPALATLALALPACASLASSPSSAPDFQIEPLQGQAIIGGEVSNFSQVLSNGKPVVLNFFAGNCPPCRAELPSFQRVADNYQAKVIFLSVDVGTYTGLGTRDQARQLLQDLGIRYPAAFAVDSSPVRLYGIQSMPTTVFVTPKREIFEKFSGMLVEDQMRSELQKLVAV
jgi:thiol-disulfide isomerase/thioredoxin